MKGKLKFILPVLLLVLVGGGGAYKFLLSGGGSAKKAPPPKVAGELLALAPDFTINLDGGHYGKVSVALELEGGLPAAAEGAAPVLKENAVVRSIVTERPHRPHDRRPGPAALAREAAHRNPQRCAVADR